MNKTTYERITQEDKMLITNYLRFIHIRTRFLLNIYLFSDIVVWARTRVPGK